MNIQTKEIPDVPQGETVEEILHIQRQRWENFFTNISSRITVLPTPTTLTLDKLQELTKKALDIVDDSELDTVLLHGWPQQEDVAFIVKVDMSMPGRAQQFRAEDYSLFLYGANGGIAYDLSYFDVDEEYAPIGFDYVYSLHNWEPDTLIWEFRAKLIIDRIKDLQKRVPDLPE